jgi:hypothetical protein
MIYHGETAGLGSYPQAHEAQFSMSGRKVFFERLELDRLLRFYGRMVAAGEWRDYALDALPDRALFSVYRRTSEAPLYQIEKRPEDARRQGAYSVRAVDGRILRRGHDLARVIAVLEPRRMQVIGD